MLTRISQYYIRLTLMSTSLNSKSTPWVHGQRNNCCDGGEFELWTWKIFVPAFDLVRRVLAVQNSRVSLPTPLSALHQHGAPAAFPQRQFRRAPNHSWFARGGVFSNMRNPSTAFR